MPKKAAISSSKRADKLQANASGRSILVVDSAANSDEPATFATQTDHQADPAPVVNRTAKTIQPLENAANKLEPASAPADQPIDTAEPNALVQQPIHETTAAASQTDQPTGPIVPPDPVSDTEAAKRASETKQAAAAEARQQELEALVASGKYAVPINAVRRKQSRLYVAITLVLVVLLASITLDLLADAGTVSLPGSLPHTHLLPHN